MKTTKQQNNKILCPEYHEVLLLLCCRPSYVVHIDRCNLLQTPKKSPKSPKTITVYHQANTSLPRSGMYSRQLLTHRVHGDIESV